jgi:hypothetical protein
VPRNPGATFRPTVTQKAGHGRPQHEDPPTTQKASRAYVAYTATKRIVTGRMWEPAPNRTYIRKSAPKLSGHYKPTAGSPNHKMPKMSKSEVQQFIEAGATTQIDDLKLIGIDSFGPTFSNPADCVVDANSKGEIFITITQTLPNSVPRTIRPGMLIAVKVNRKKTRYMVTKHLNKHDTAGSALKLMVARDDSLHNLRPRPTTLTTQSPATVVFVHSFKNTVSHRRLEFNDRAITGQKGPQSAKVGAAGVGGKKFRNGWSRAERTVQRWVNGSDTDEDTPNNDCLVIVPTDSEAADANILAELKGALQSIPGEAPILATEAKTAEVRAFNPLSNYADPNSHHSAEAWKANNVVVVSKDIHLLVQAAHLANEYGRHTKLNPFGKKVFLVYDTPKDGLPVSGRAFEPLLHLLSKDDRRFNFRNFGPRPKGPFPTTPP